MELCDGNVYPNVELDYDGCGGGCCGGDYHIEVKFVCDKCGTTHQEFPRDEHWYNQFVKELMDGRNIEEIRSELLQKQKDHQEHVRKLAEKYERESKARIASAKAARLKKEKK
jgi:predicted metal-dependent RNase